MRYVVDSCVSIKWFLAESDSDSALRLRDEFCSALHDLIAPDVFPIEVSHALTWAQRQGRVTATESLTHFQDMLTVMPDLHGCLPLLPRAFDISSLTRTGLYDCLYVALAEREGIELVTADERLINNLGRQFPFIISLSSFDSP